MVGSPARCQATLERAYHSGWRRAAASWMTTTLPHHASGARLAGEMASDARDRAASAGSAAYSHTCPRRHQSRPWPHDAVGGGPQVRKPPRQLPRPPLDPAELGPAAARALMTMRCGLTR